MPKAMCSKSTFSLETSKKKHVSYGQRDGHINLQDLMSKQVQVRFNDDEQALIDTVCSNQKYKKYRDVKSVYMSVILEIVGAATKK